ncbi:flagellar biosynthetic protein FliO [Neobacillus niacini]|uniref:flagellar biosynthetic protein FliO n=1 Tax=Neobacillus niacini TaxID=86668 RepID=UPI002040858C|nr:flagellar biosynthetic protein FliO [Neobacillus niacini]
MKRRYAVSPWNKWLVLLAVCLLVFVSPLSQAHAAEDNVYNTFQKKSDDQPADGDADSPLTAAPKSSTGLYLLQFFGSFILIIGLLYFVLRFVSKKAKQGVGVFHALGGHSFGNNRSMQMVMVGDTLYILGVGDDVNLIRAIPPGDEQTSILETVAVKPLDFAGKSKWTTGIFKRKTAQEKFDEHLFQQLKGVEAHQKHNED